VGNGQGRLVFEDCRKGMRTCVSMSESTGVLNLPLLQERSEMAYMQDLREGRGRKFCTYFEEVKEGYSFEPYVDQLAISEYAAKLAKFRVGSHKLAIETGSWRRIARDERTCQICRSGAIESELGISFMIALLIVTSGRSSTSHLRIGGIES
jgi:hypothetical protein